MKYNIKELLIKMGKLLDDNQCDGGCNCDTKLIERVDI